MSLLDDFARTAVLLAGAALATVILYVAFRRRVRREQHKALQRQKESVRRREAERYGYPIDTGREERS